MICHTCNTQAVENFANGKQFFYCRTCKEEVLEAARPHGMPSLPKDIYDGLSAEEKQEFEDWLAGIDPRSKKDQQRFLGLDDDNPDDEFDAFYWDGSGD